jgi:hypothetical protein
MPTAWCAKTDSVDIPLPLCPVFGMPRVFKKTAANRVRRHMRPHRFAFGLYFHDRKAPGYDTDGQTLRILRHQASLYASFDHPWLYDGVYRCIAVCRPGADGCKTAL